MSNLWFVDTVHAPMVGARVPACGVAGWLDWKDTDQPVTCLRCRRRLCTHPESLRLFEATRDRWIEKCQQCKKTLADRATATKETKQ
jgi:hypothetical protein